MKKATKLLLLLLALTLSLTLFACGGGGGDNGEDDGGDEEEEVINDVILIEDGTPKFNIVFGKTTDSDTRNAIRQQIVSKLEKVDIVVNAVPDGGENDVPQDVEVLVGDVTSRGDKYVFDGHQFGKEGYMIKIVGTKVVIQAGSDEQLLKAVEEFAEDILKIGTDDVFYAKMTKDDVVFKIQDDYNIKTLSVNGNNMKDYKIATDTSNIFFKNAALMIQDEVYEKTGIWLEIEDSSVGTENVILIKAIDRVYGDESYSVKADGKKLVVSCAYENMLEKATEEFLIQKITLARKDVDFTGTVYKRDVSFITYEDFGAVGDGVTDDYQALYYAHKSANQYGQKVIGTRGATYYLYDCYFTDEDTNRAGYYSIPIQTDVDWQDCTIVIDDRLTHNYSGGKVFSGAKDTVNADDHGYKVGHTAVFQVLPNEEHKKITVRDKTVIDKIVADELKPGTTHVDFKLDGWDGDLMIIPYSSYHNVYRRRGYGQFNGANMHEILIIDKDGNISEETKVMFNYQSIDYIDVYKIDKSTAITIENAKVITRESRIDHTIEGKFQGGYVTRGLSVQRSYTTVKNIEHVVTDGFSIAERAYEGLEGPSQNGFFVASNANHITFKDCIMPGRVKYNNSSSYNFSAATVNYIVLDGCIQSNFWVTVDENYNLIPSSEWSEGAKTSMGSVTVPDANFDGRRGSSGKSFGFHWGLGGTNWCKNMEYLNSKISRFDAHQGLYDGRIINTEINDMELTGVGKLEIADVKWYSYSDSTPLLFLRSDYGYTWDGEITLKNVEAYIHRNQSLVMSNHSYVNWYFGYISVMPSVSIDNLDLYWFDDHTTVHSGYEIQLTKVTNQKMHLLDAGSAPIIPYNDVDKDGYIDEPIFDINRDGYIDEKDDIDLDGDGDKFNTTMPYLTEKEHGDQDTYRKGTVVPGITTNVNVTRPPEYYKVLNNDGVGGAGGYKFTVPNTAGSGISDGMWYSDTDSMNGFFGGTKFIYDGGEFVGTVAPKGVNTPFLFK